MSGEMHKKLMSNEIVRPRDLPQITGLSRTTIWRLEKSHDFVNKIRLTRTSVGYKRSDIERWIEERIEQQGQLA